MADETATDYGAIDSAPAANEDASPKAAQPEDETALLRDLIVRAHPDAVPELIHGTSLGEMLASLPEAQAVYTRIIAASRENAPTPAAPTAPGPVPAGSSVRTPAIDARSLSAMAKIKAGIRER